ncbi:hypothetical protein [Tahibacter caeni]|uniref:hypothetical protein n=1 Tax=Tahibacter caeni TaxID=1453545 RepID=UPI002148BF75|nr:hypothetical protein [Tahibacter caeni]
MGPIRLIDVQDGRELARIERADLDFLIDVLEEESSTDHDYFVDRDTLDYLAERGAEAALLSALRHAMGAREEMEFRWELADQ